MLGALLKDVKGIMVQQTKNIQAARQIWFTDIEGILQMQPTLKAYIKEATTLEKAGKKVGLKKPIEFYMT